MRNTKSLLLLAALICTGCVVVRYGESGPIPRAPEPQSVLEIEIAPASVYDMPAGQAGDTTLVRYLQVGEQCSVDDGVEYRILRCWSPQQTRVKVDTASVEAGK